MPIEIANLTRSYEGARGAPTVQALRGITLSIPDAEIFGILGPNGAGKTTLVRILATLLTPTSGTANVNGLDVVTDAKEVRRQVGVAFGGERGLYDRLSATDNLRFAAQLYSVSPRRIRGRVSELLELVGLADKSKARVETFSRGMKQRLHIARALIHDPAVVFLDEPSSGLDPVAARALRELAGELRERGKTILLATHSMVEADELCDRVSIISSGEILRMGTPEQVKADVSLGRILEVEAYDDPAEAISLIRTLPTVSAVEHASSGDTVRVIVRLEPESDMSVADIISRMDGNRIGRAFDREPTLEDAYVSIVEAGIR
ncbi:ABC transporter ATP-binding protein [uncultured Leifsonia sp.]|uniref:ABC transporter ATP-binding protein n=1 Tax=uncultured Leifsonia sp. TaxID=340359 RepID=UPI0025D70D0F|nr:ABC transporter ATP-binding protein [uncultured Leifsonia sp.]